jgi:SAM-dependent methyltransferase
MVTGGNGAPLRVLKRILRAVVPSSVRQSRFVTRLRWFLYERMRGHDAIYDSEYFTLDVEATAANSAEAIAESIRADLRPHSAMDVGCGTGALLQALRSRGCAVAGLEYSEAALAYCRARALDVRKFDLERDTLADDRTFDVAISMEVAEHLPEHRADRYVALLARLAPVIVFTAAPPGQGGRDHVNEQPPEYWMAKFNASGFAHDDVLSTGWRERWSHQGTVAPWYHRNLMVFRRN